MTRILLVASLSLALSAPVRAEPAAAPEASPVVEVDLGDPPRGGGMLASFLAAEAVWAGTIGLMLLLEKQSGVETVPHLALLGGPLVTWAIGDAQGWDGSIGWSIAGSYGGALVGALGGGLIAVFTTTDLTEGVIMLASIGTATSALGATLGWWVGAEPTPEHRARWRAEERARLLRAAERRRASPKKKKTKPRRKRREAPPPPPPSEVMPWLGALPDADGRLVPAVGLGGRF